MAPGARRCGSWAEPMLSTVASKQLRGHLVWQMESSGTLTRKHLGLLGGWLSSAWSAEVTDRGALGDMLSRPGGHWPIPSCCPALSWGPGPAVIPAVPSSATLGHLATGSALTMVMAGCGLDIPFLPSWAISTATLLTFASGMK